jgi:hypothetical protein
MSLNSLYTLFIEQRFFALKGGEMKRMNLIFFGQVSTLSIAGACFVI